MAPPNRTTHRQHHAVAVPLPAQGHINPLMRLCKLLASRHSFRITFVNIDSVHHRLSSLQTHSHVEDAGPVDNSSDLRGRIRLAHVPLPALDLSNGLRLSLEHFFQALQSIAGDLEDLIRGLSPPATCLISDFLLTSPTQLVADRLGIPRVMLFTSSQCYHLLRFYLCSGRLSVDHVIQMAKECDPKTYLQPAHEGQVLEGLVPLHKKDLPCYKHVVDDTEYLYHLAVSELQKTYERSHAIVVNSFLELEGDAIETFTRLTGKPPLHVVGPLIEELSNESRTSLWKEDDGCMSWLDKQPSNSVLYISFGSVTLLSREQFEALLSGLELSKQKVLWAFRPDIVEGTIPAIPQRFLDRTSDCVCFIAWAPQLSVLKHPAVGAFLTHCGWNSTLEAIANGIPMLCWPYFADQFLDARYIVDVWKVGMALRYPSDCDTLIVPKEEIERCVRAIMEGEEGKALRQNAARFREAALKCHEDGGSSRVSMEALVASLAYHIPR